MTTWLLIGVALSAWLGVALVRWYGQVRLLDVPNERSSHRRSTPRGGGLGIALAHSVGVVVAALFDLLAWDLAVAATVGGLVVGAIGFVDDHGHVPSVLRLVCHFVAVGWALAWIGNLPPIDFGWGFVDLGRAGALLTMLCLVWFLNLFNFMDGIDGIASTQAASMAAVAAALTFAASSSVNHALPMLLLLAATAGFLVWNWPPARIFLGDVGSGYLGYALGVLALWSIVSGFLSPWVWLILAGVFLCDATVTLIVRVLSGASITEPHRTHAYQRLSRYWGGHLPVTALVAGVNLLWLAPWAAAATVWPRLGAAFAAMALVPLTIAVSALGAGRPGEISKAG